MIIYQSLLKSHAFVSKKVLTTYLFLKINKKGKVAIGKVRYLLNTV